MGLVDKLLAWLEAVYKDLKALIRVNDLDSDPILLTRGMREGCPLITLTI